jgi:SAM-dependent methyltransferase
MGFGRLGVIEKLASEFNGFSLNIGCKETVFGDINVDININLSPDILSHVCHSPFKSNIFDVVYFNDVIGYLSKNDSKLTMKEINRILKKGGILIFSAPNDRTIFNILDIETYILRYSHCKRKYIENLIRECGFNIKQIFTSGSYWVCITYLWYCLISFPINKIFKASISYAPSLLIRLSNSEYEEKNNKGYTIFCIGEKIN